jgi:uncharacterized protein with HEPN domain
MRETDRDYLADMLDHAEFAMQSLGSNGVAEVAADRAKFAVLCHMVQTVGEAANQVSAETRSDLAEIPWPKVIGMRHRLVHSYRTVAIDLVVGTVRDDLPPLAAALRRALENDAP